MTFQEFLKLHPSSTSLDVKSIKRQFKTGDKRADFLLFGHELVCEYKEFTSIDVKRRVEKLYKKGELPPDVFQREMHSSMNDAVAEADRQIEDTKRVLGYPEALGMIVLENKIPSNLSVATLLQVANKNMMDGLPSVDAVFCLDLANFFTGPDGNQVMPIQLVSRKTDRSAKVGMLWRQIVVDFCRETGRPFVDNFVIGESHVRWHTQNGEFIKHSARIVRREEPSSD